MRVAQPTTPGQLCSFHTLILGTSDGFVIALGAASGLTAKFAEGAQANSDLKDDCLTRQVSIQSPRVQPFASQQGVGLGAGAGVIAYPHRAGDSQRVQVRLSPIHPKGLPKGVRHSSFGRETCEGG